MTIFQLSTNLGLSIIGAGEQCAQLCLIAELTDVTKSVHGEKTSSIMYPGYTKTELFCC